MRKIYLNDKDINKAIEQFKAKITQYRADALTIDLPKKYSKHEVATLEFAQKAWIKTMGLVATFSGEVQWHGVVSRKNDNTWYVEDILVFPHKCTSVSVISDQEKYEEWLNNLDDATFNKVKLHGHSHVNMDVSPSGCYGNITQGNNDESYRQKMIDGLPSTTDYDNYYIFVIFNKSMKWSARIYDLHTNRIFDSNDKEIDVTIDGVELDEFIDEAKTLTKPDVATTITSQLVQLNSTKNTLWSDGPYSDWFK